jgi:PPOX class probable F420-dependent enzyme
MTLGNASPLAKSNYLSLATFRKTGAEVRTPVWFAQQGDTIYLFSNGKAGKVKRLRNSTRARVAACDVRGKVWGNWSDAEARLLAASEDHRAAHRALLDKYGWQMAMLDFFANLFGRARQRVFIEVRLTGV